MKYKRTTKKDNTGHEVINLFSVSSQLSMKFDLLINLTIPTIVYRRHDQIISTSLLNLMVSFNRHSLPLMGIYSLLDEQGKLLFNVLTVGLGLSSAEAILT